MIKVAILALVALVGTTGLAMSSQLKKSGQTDQKLTTQTDKTPTPKSLKLGKQPKETKPADLK